MPTELEGKFYEYLYRTNQADAEWNQQVLLFYVPFFAHCKHVLDVGCGQGQFIELLTARGIQSSGVDSDSVMVRICRQKGFEVVNSNLFDYLPQQAGQFDGIFCSNLIEHLSATEAWQFIQLAFKVLRPGGVFLVATPNPASLIVHLHEFWRDATHVRLYNAALLEFLLGATGFQNAEWGENPHTTWLPPAGFSQLPELWKSPSPAAPVTAIDNPAIPDAANVPWWRRLRRRLARFLVQTIMFEEFQTLVKRLDTLDENTSRSLMALHTTQNTLLAVPREVFVVGRKPEEG